MTLLRILTLPFRIVYRWFANLFSDFREFFSPDPDDSPLPEAFAKTIENPYGVVEHLDALRKHLLRAVLFLALTTAVSFTFSAQLLEFFASPLEDGLASLVAIEPTEPIGTVMRVSLLSGFALAFPYIALEIWLFVGPGLSRRARFSGLLTIPVATIFFVTGMAFAYYVMLPNGLDFLLHVAGFETELTPSSYFKFVTNVVFWIGLVFEFPLVVFILAKLGLVNARSLARQWRMAIVVISVLAAMITPTVDPVNMSLIMGPMILLYFFSVFLAFIAQRSRKAEEPAPA